MEDINLEGLDYEIEPGHKFTMYDLKEISTAEKDYRLEDRKGVKEFYAKIGGTIPEKLMNQRRAQIDRLQK